MTRDERRERGTRLCRELSRRVAAVASPGLGAWEEAWRVVEEPSARFLDVLHRWEETGDMDARAELEPAASAVLSAWREAAQRYREGARRGVPA